MEIQVVQPYNSSDTVIALKNSCLNFIREIRFFMVINISIAVHALLMCMLTSLSVDEILLPRYMNWSTNFKGLPFDVKTAPSWLRHINSFSSSHENQCLLLPIPGYVVDIWLEQASIYLMNMDLCLDLKTNLSKVVLLYSCNTNTSRLKYTGDSVVQVQTFY